MTGATNAHGQVAYAFWIKGFGATFKGSGVNSVLSFGDKILIIVAIAVWGARRPYTQVYETPVARPNYNYAARLGFLRVCGMSTVMSDRPSILASQRYRERAEECRAQAQSFRDPKARAQMLQLAANYESKARQAEAFEETKEVTCVTKTPV